MGKWAMYRHRGGVTVPTPPAFPYPPPVYTTDWTAAPDGGDPLALHVFSVDVTPPLGVGAIQIRGATINPPDPPLSTTELTIGDDGILLSLDAPATVYTQARWIVSTGDTAPLSDWSDVHSTDLG